jgi:methionyl-tRNA synthetase
VSLGEATARHGPDALRYFLLREVGFEADGNFTWERFDERYVADLADGLGNLASRSLAMLEKYRGGIVPDSADATPLDRNGDEAVRRYQAAMDALDLRGGAEAAWDLVDTANLYIQQSAPWTLAKTAQDEPLNVVLGALARALYRLAVLVAPFIPDTAHQLWLALGQTESVDGASWDTLTAPPVAGRRTSKPSILFPKPAAA